MSKKARMPVHRHRAFVEHLLEFFHPFFDRLREFILLKRDIADDAVTIGLQFRVIHAELADDGQRELCQERFVIPSLRPSRIARRNNRRTI